MDGDSPPDAQFKSESTTVNHGSAPYAGAFFPRSQNFTISGSTLTSVTHNHTSLAVPTDFRRIPLGDIDLRNEIHFHKASGVIHYQRSRGSVRRMYSAKIDGQKSNMTVALYEGDNAEEEWRDVISKYSCLRHPNVLQIFAVASSTGIHAIVAHDDLIPFYDFLKLYRKSPILTVYIYGCWYRDIQEAFGYINHMFEDANSSSIWVRRSTGRLCVDLTPTEWPTPTTITGIANPLTDLLHGSPKKGSSIIWCEACQRAFDTLKRALTATRMLIHPTPWLLYGHDLRLPNDLHARLEHIKNLEKYRQESNAKALARLEAAKRDGEMVDRGLGIGDLVLRKSERQSKLHPRWDGPFIIYDVSDKNTYQLMTRSGYILRHLYNGTRIRPYFPAIDQRPALEVPNAALWYASGDLQRRDAQHRLRSRGRA